MVRPYVYPLLGGVPGGRGGLCLLPPTSIPSWEGCPEGGVGYAYCLLPLASCLFPVPRSLFPIFCLFPTAYCLLPTAFFPKELHHL